MSKQATAETAELQPMLPFEDFAHSGLVLETPTEDSPKLSFFEELRELPIRNKLRLMAAVGSIGLIAVGSTMLGVHLQDQDENAARDAASTSAMALKSCLGYVRSLPGQEPKIITASLIPLIIRDNCGISKKLEYAKESSKSQNRGVFQEPSYDAELMDTSGSEVRLPYEASLEDRIIRLSAEAADHNPIMRIVLGAMSGINGLLAGVVVVNSTTSTINKVRLRRRELAMKAR